MPATLLDRLARRACRHTSPCGEGQLVWRTWGVADGPPVVLLHGGSGHWGHWVRNLEALLSAGWRVIVPDLPGFGDSTAPPDGEDADALARLLPELRCPVHGIWGEHDVLYAMRRPLVAEVLSRAPGFRGLAWIAGAGHWVMFEQAPAFDAALLGALAAPHG